MATSVFIPKAGSGGGGITSVFGRFGPAILAVLGDYTSSLVTNLSGVAGATVTIALDNLAAAIVAIAPATKEVWFSPQENASEGHYRVRNVGGMGMFEFSFAVPHDFTSIVALEMIVVSVAGGTLAFDLESEYAADGEQINNHTSTIIGLTKALTANEWGTLDISTAFPSLAAGDRCGINIDQNAGAGAVDHLFIRVRYN